MKCFADQVFQERVLPFQIQVHGSNVEDVYNYIPKSVLPKEYGGEDGTVQDLITHWEEMALKHRDYLINCEKYGSDETKRAGKSKHADTLFGVEGSFRKLEID